MGKKDYIKNAGYCIVSNNVLNGKGFLKWLVREEPVNKEDNGWRIFSDIDDDIFINNSSNLSLRDFNDIADIEPAIIAIYRLPVGSDIQLIKEKNKKYFWDNITDKKIDMESLYI